MNSAITLTNVTKRYPAFTLDNVSFTLPTGCILGLVGENGAGKSTTLRLIMNALGRDGGEISVLGMDNRSSEFQSIKEDVGVVLDEAYFPEVLTVEQVAKIMANTYCRWNAEKFWQLMQRFDLPRKQAFKSFSRGMKMKLAIAVALSHDPKLLLLDEATSGLDPIVRDEILDIFSDFTRDEGHSILLSSHIVSDLEKLCDYIGFLHKGKLVLFEEKDQLLEEYGILSCTHAQISDLPQEAVFGMEQGSYGVRALIKRGLVSSAFHLDRPTLEDIILFMVKGAKQ